MTAHSPTAPSPITATLSPGFTPAVRAACLDLRVLDVLDAYVAGLVKECRAHMPYYSSVIFFSSVIAVIAAGQPA